MAEFACASEIRKGMADPMSATPSSIQFRRLPARSLTSNASPGSDSTVRPGRAGCIDHRPRSRYSRRARVHTILAWRPVKVRSFRSLCASATTWHQNTGNSRIATAWFTACLIQ